MRPIQSRKFLPHVGHTWNQFSCRAVAAMVLRCLRFLRASADLVASEVREPLVIRARQKGRSLKLLSFHIHWWFQIGSVWCWLVHTVGLLSANGKAKVVPCRTECVHAELHLGLRACIQRAIISKKEIPQYSLLHLVWSRIGSLEVALVPCGWVGGSAGLLLGYFLLWTGVRSPCDCRTPADCYYYYYTTCHGLFVGWTKHWLFDRDSGIRETTDSKLTAVIGWRLLFLDEQLTGSDVCGQGFWHHRSLSEHVCGLYPDEKVLYWFSNCCERP